MYVIEKIIGIFNLLGVIQLKMNIAVFITILGIIGSCLSAAIAFISIIKFGKSSSKSDEKEYSLTVTIKDKEGKVIEEEKADFSESQANNLLRGVQKQSRNNAFP